MSDVIVAFDDYVYGTASVYSSSFLHAILGEREAYSLQAVVDPLPGTPNGTITVQLETSGDGRNWVAKNQTAEISAAIAATVETIAFGYDANVRPGLALVRLNVALTGSPGTPAAHVQVFVTRRQDPKFVPARIPGCNAWLRADLGVTLAGSSVTAWSDASGRGHDATQGTATRQPQYNQSPINGMPTIFFDASTVGSEKILSMGGGLSLTSAHAFLVAKNISAIPPTSARSGLWRLGNSGSASELPFTDGTIYDDLGSNTRYVTGAPVVTLTNPFVYEVRAIAGNWKSLINGTAQFTNVTNTVAWSATLELGGNSGAGVFYDGHIGEFMLFDHVLTDAERRSIISYINSRYTLSIT